MSFSRSLSAKGEGPNNNSPESFFSLDTKDTPASISLESWSIDDPQDKEKQKQDKEDKKDKESSDENLQYWDLIVPKSYYIFLAFVFALLIASSIGYFVDTYFGFCRKNGDTCIVAETAKLYTSAF